MASQFTLGRDERNPAWLRGGFIYCAEGQNLLFGHKENRFPACGDGFGMSDCRLRLFRRSARIQGLKRRKVYLCNAVKLWRTARRTDHLSCDNLGLSM